MFVAARGGGKIEPTIGTGGAIAGGKQNWIANGFEMKSLFP